MLVKSLNKMQLGKVPKGIRSTFPRGNKITFPKGNRVTFKPEVQVIVPQTNKLSKLEQDVTRLNVLLNREREQSTKEKKEKLMIHHELEETKKQLEREKAQKEFFMNRCKQLERQQGHTSQDIAANQIQNKRGKRRVAEEEMEVDNTSTSAELGGETNKLLKEELEKVKRVLNEQGLRYQHDMHSAGQQIQTFQQEMGKQLKAHTDRVSHDQAFIKHLTDEKDALQKNMAEESSKHQNIMQSARQQVEALQCELQHQKQAHVDKDSQFQEYVTSLTAEYNASCQKMAEENAVLLQKVQMCWTELQQTKTQLSGQKDIQKDHQELQAMHKNCVEQFRAQIQQERSNTMFFKEKLQLLAAKFQELNQRHQSEVSTLEHQAKSQLCQFEIETKSHSDQLTRSQEVNRKLRAEQEALQQSYQEKERFYVRQLEELGAQLNDQLQKTMELTEQLHADREESVPPTRKRSRCEERPEDEDIVPSKRIRSRCEERPEDENTGSQ